MTFWAKVAIGAPDECWPWTACTKKRGYGHLSWHGRTWIAHRLAFFLATGIDPGKLHVLHSCDNPPCCNPRHLFLGTHADNVADKVAKGRQARGGALPQTKLAEADVMAIRAFSASGMAQRAIAARYGIAQSTVGDIVNGATWAVVLSS